MVIKTNVMNVLREKERERKRARERERERESEREREKEKEKRGGERESLVCFNVCVIKKEREKVIKFLIESSH